jgi:hypothetical protein
MAEANDDRSFFGRLRKLFSLKRNFFIKQGFFVTRPQLNKKFIEQNKNAKSTPSLAFIGKHSDSYCSASL